MPFTIDELSKIFRKMFEAKMVVDFIKGQKFYMTERFDEFININNSGIMTEGELR